MLSILREQVSDNRKLRAKTGQAGLELIAFFAGMLLVFSVAYLFLNSKTLSALNFEASQEAERIADRAASEINTAVAEGSGYSKSFKLPDSIRGANYTVSVEEGTVFVDWSKNSVISNTIVDNVTGNFTYGWNIIQNKGGGIFVNKSTGE